MPDQIPPDTRTVGEGNPAADMDSVADTLAEITGISPGTSWTPGQVPLQGQYVSVQGLPGAASGTRVTGATLSGPPVSGTFQAGDVVTDLSGQLWLAVKPGTPGFWTTAQLRAAQALTPFRAALANRQNATCSIACIGDSITEGQHATGPTGPASTIGFDNRWLARLRDMLRARYPTPGLSGGGRGFIGVSGTGESSFTWPTTIGTVVTTPIDQGPKGGDSSHSAARQITSASPGPISWALNGDHAGIMYVQVFGGGDFEWSVDGGSTTTVPTTGTTTDGKIVTVSLGSAGAHTLAVQWASGASVDIDGVIEYDGDYGCGIQVHDCGHFGWTAASWVTSLNSGAASGPAAAIAALEPSCVIITLGVNDQYDAITPAAFGSNLQTIITSLKAQLASPYPSFVLQMLPPRVGQSGYTYPWYEYTAAAWAVAAADTSGPGSTSLVTVLDWTQGPLAPGADTDVYGIWQSGDNVHPSDLGHQLIADRLTDFVIGH